MISWQTWQFTCELYLLFFTSPSCHEFFIRMKWNKGYITLADIQNVVYVSHLPSRGECYTQHEVYVLCLHVYSEYIIHEHINNDNNNNNNDKGIVFHIALSYFIFIYRLNWSLRGNNSEKILSDKHRFSHCQEVFEHFWENWNFC